MKNEEKNKELYNMNIVYSAIRWQATLEKCFNAPVENALWMRQFGVNWVEIGELLSGFNHNNYFVLTPDLYIRIRHNWVKIATVRAQTNRQTDKHTGVILLSVPLCYSSKTNNNNNNNNNDDIYSAVIVAAQPLREFTRFTRWI